MKTETAKFNGVRGQFSGDGRWFWPENESGLRAYAATGVWYLRARVNGKIIEQSLRTTNLGDAKQARDAALVEKREQAKAGIVDDKSTLAAFVGWYLQDLDRRLGLGKEHDRGGLAPATAKTYRGGLKTFERLAKGLLEKPLCDITEADLKAVLEAVRPTFSKTTFNAIYIPLESIFKEALHQKVIAQNPFDFIPRSSKKCVARQIPTRDEYDAIVAALADPHYSNPYKRETVDFIEGLAWTGLRIGEAQRLLKSDVDIPRRVIHVRGGKTDAAKRDVPIFEPAVPLFEKILAAYPGERFFPLDRCDGTLAYVEAKLKLPFALCHHTFRHVFATYCLEEGADIFAVSKWLGHADVNVTQNTYTHARDQWLKKQAPTKEEIAAREAQFVTERMAQLDAPLTDEQMDLILAGGAAGRGFF